MNSHIDDRTNRPDASNPHDTSADVPAVATDLEILDAEARSDIDRRPHPRAIFIGVGPSAPMRGRRTRTAAANTLPAAEKSVFRRMMDSFFGLDAPR